MKELEKIKNISIASTLFILAIIIGLLSYKRPTIVFANNSKTTLEKLTNDSVFISYGELDNPNHFIIDIRSEYEYNKGHLKNVTNIYTPEILKAPHLNLFKKLQQEGKLAILYGNHPEQANAPFLILHQLGFSNLKILRNKNTFSQNQLITTPIIVERCETNIAAFISESKKNQIKVSPKKIEIPPKKIIKVEQKKKIPVEGGC